MTTILPSLRDYAIELPSTIEEERELRVFLRSIGEPIYRDTAFGVTKNNRYSDFTHLIFSPIYEEWSLNAPHLEKIITFEQILNYKNLNKGFNIASI